MTEFLTSWPVIQICQLKAKFDRMAENKAVIIRPWSKIPQTDAKTPPACFQDITDITQIYFWQLLVLRFVGCHGQDRIWASGFVTIKI